jgi:hypothetical protein
MSAEKPKELYRGRTVDPKDLNPEFFQQPLTAGEKEVDADGNRPDGNEHGVYMSDNAGMVRSTDYSNPRQGTPDNDVPRFHDGRSMTRLEVPRVGVMYRISTDGLEIREPHIGDVLKTHMLGREWIADEVPTSHYEPTRIVLSPDSMHDSRAWEIDDEHSPLEVVLSEVEKENANRRGLLALLAARVSELTPQQRAHDRTIKKIIEEIRAFHAESKQSA